MKADTMPVSMSSVLSRFSCSEESGLVMGVVAITVVSTLLICGLAIDSWNMMLETRRLQDIVDIAAQTGIAQISNPNCAGCYPTDSTGWAKIKKSVLASLSVNKIPGLNSLAQTHLDTQILRFLSGKKTANDLNDYKHDTASAGNLKVKVTRGVACYDDFGQRRLISLEGDVAPWINQWCHANYVQVDLYIFDFKTLFMDFIGLSQIPQIHVTAGAQNNVPFTCGSDLCSNLGTIDPVTSKFTPFPC